MGIYIYAQAIARTFVGTAVNRGLTLTSASGQGELNGNGRAWWSLPGVGYLIHQEQRPRLLTIANSSDVLVEKLLFADSPY